MRIEENMGECLIIRTGGGTDTTNANATAGVVLSGYSCYVNEQLITGTMTNRGSIGTQTLSPGGSYTIPGGWHNGAGKVSVGSLSSATSADAGAANVLSGYTGWVNGTKITGTMTNRGAVSQALAANGSYTIPAGWHNGSGKVTQSLTTQAAVSITPGRANKTACAANRWTTGIVTIVGSSALTAGNIKNGVTIFGIKGTFSGWVDNEFDPIAGGCLYLVWDLLPPPGQGPVDISNPCLIRVSPAPTNIVGSSCTESAYPKFWAMCRTFKRMRLSVTYWVNRATWGEQSLKYTNYVWYIDAEGKLKSNGGVTMTPYGTISVVEGGTYSDVPTGGKTLTRTMDFKSASSGTNLFGTDGRPVMFGAMTARCFRDSSNTTILVEAKVNSAYVRCYKS